MRAYRLGPMVVIADLQVQIDAEQRAAFDAPVALPMLPSEIGPWDDTQCRPEAGPLRGGARGTSCTAPMCSAHGACARQTGLNETSLKALCVLVRAEHPEHAQRLDHAAQSLPFWAPETAKMRAREVALGLFADGAGQELAELAERAIREACGCPIADREAQ